MVGVLLLAAVGSYWWDELWRALHPPIRFDPATLPQPFDWGEVARRMAAYRDAEGEGDSPEESDSVYLMIRDKVTLEYADVARRILSQYDGSVRWCASDPEWALTVRVARALSAAGTSGGSIRRSRCPARTAD